MRHEEHKVKLRGMDKREAESEVKQIYIDRYGAKNVTSYKAMGDPVIKAKGYDDQARVGSDGAGNAVVDMADAGASTRSLIEQLTNWSSEAAKSHVERGVDQFEKEEREGTRPGSPTRTGSSQTVGSGIEKDEVVDYGDGSIRFRPRFTQREASYLYEGDREYDDEHPVCDECAHFIEGGGCHMVEGPIELDGYCEEFYADVGVFAHRHDEGVEENLSVWGYDFDWSISDAEEFAMDIREILEAKIRGSR